MPLIVITLPEKALSKAVQTTLAQESSQALLTLENLHTNEKAQLLSWVYLNKHTEDEFFIGGKQAMKPHYRFDITLFKNTLSNDHKSVLTQRLTELTFSLENSANNPLNAARIWVIFHEVEEGNWGGAGQIYSLNTLKNLLKNPQ